MDRVLFSRRDAVKLTGAACVGLSMGSAFAAGELPLITRKIPSSGEELPVIGLGTNAYGVTDPAEIAARREVLRRMPELGGKVVDTARGYGASEEVIGRLVAELGNRDKLFIATKTPMNGDVSNPDAVIEESFRRLAMDRIDLMQVHNMHGLDTLLPAFEKWKKDGRIRYIGVSTSFNPQYEQLKQAMTRYPLDFIQVDYSIDNRDAADEILPLAEERGIAVLANTPFNGRRNAASLFARVADRKLPDWAAEIDVATWPQFFLKYVVSHPAVTVAIPGTTKLSHLEDNQRAARGRLPDADMRRRMEQFWDSLAAT